MPPRVRMLVSMCGVRCGDLAGTRMDAFRRRWRDGLAERSGDRLPCSGRSRSKDDASVGDRRAWSNNEVDGAPVEVNLRAKRVSK